MTDQSGEKIKRFASETPYTVDEVAKAQGNLWPLESLRMLAEIQSWLAMPSEMITDNGYPVLRMHASSPPVERLHTRPQDMLDESMPFGIRGFGCIDWVTEDGPPVACARPYGSRTHGTRRCTLVYNWTDRWWIYVPEHPRPPSSLYSMLHRLSPINTIILDRLSFAEVASALLVR